MIFKQSILRCFSAVIVGAAAIVFFTSCDGNSGTKAARVSYESVKGSATLTGHVRFLGKPPEMKTIRNEPCCEGSPKTLLEETVLVGADSGLKNVFVYIIGGPLVDGVPLPKVVLDQVHCQYIPHVVGVTVGQPLLVKSSDNTFHNTHYTPGKNASENFGLLRAGDGREVRFPNAEIFPVRCDIHPWMNAHIGVFDNPFFAATAADGSYSIANLPAGQYSLVAWHEIYGELRQQITIANGATVEANFDYKPPN